MLCVWSFFKVWPGLWQYIITYYSESFCKASHTNFNYTGDLKSDHFKSRKIWNQDFLKIRFWMVLFSKCRAKAFAIAMASQKSSHFARFQTVFDNMAAICWILNGWASRFHSKSGLFANQPLSDHLKSGLVPISDPHLLLIIFSTVMFFFQSKEF